MVDSLTDNDVESVNVNHTLKKCESSSDREENKVNGTGDDDDNKHDGPENSAMECDEATNGLDVQKEDETETGAPVGETNNVATNDIEFVENDKSEESFEEKDATEAFAPESAAQERVDNTESVDNTECVDNAESDLSGKAHNMESSDSAKADDMESNDFVKNDKTGSDDVKDNTTGSDHMIENDKMESDEDGKGNKAESDVNGDITESDDAVKNDKIVNDDSAKDVEIRNDDCAKAIETAGDDDIIVDKQGSGASAEEEKTSEVSKNADETTSEGDKTTEAQANAKESETQSQGDAETVDEDEDDFNPLLLCPDISMDVDESPVITNSDAPPSDELSNALFTPMFSTFVDEMTGAEISFNLTPEEQELRLKMYGPGNPIQYTKIHCTACNVHLGSALTGQTNRFVHPLLKVLICKECYHFYTSGEFEKDEDGSELYCRWCGQGGQVLCCSRCEFVFCKKCIRINFGRKKLIEVRDSEEWNCFRCDPTQLKALRAMCVEFFEFVRRETARALTLNDPDYMNKDFTMCCQTYSKKRVQNETCETVAPTEKRKRRKTDVDPDYSPFVETYEGVVSPVPSTSGTAAPSTSSVKPPTAVNQITEKVPPKPTPTISEPKLITPPTPTVRVGNTIINVTGTTPSSKTIAGSGSKTLTYAGPRGTTNLGPRPTVGPRSAMVQSRPNFVARAAAGAPVRMQTVSNTAVRVSTPGFIVVPQRPQVRTIRPMQMPVPPLSSTQKSTPTSGIKHEWFEKTVRAAARVNSNLSYTLTQLNKAQATASSVEQLAVVHNKLQEILSSSINSLIQIRKNLRTEFIAGIKTIRFPPKPPSDPNDDDVILVTTTPEIRRSIPPPLTSLSTIPSNKTSVAVANNKPATVTSTNNGAPGRYLKVKSFSQLQTVSAECITIPDDDTPVKKVDEPVVLVKTPEVVEKDPLADSDEEVSEVKEKEDSDKEVEIINSPEDERTLSVESNGGSKKENESSDEEKNKDSETDKTDDEAKKLPVYNVKDDPSPQIKRMLSVKVNMQKDNAVENLIKNEPVENGTDTN